MSINYLFAYDPAINACDPDNKQKLIYSYCTGIGINVHHHS